MLGVCAACDDSEEVKIVEFAAGSEEVIAGDGGGLSTLAIYSTGNVSVRIEGESPDWIELSNTDFHGDGEVSIYVAANPGVLRMATLNVSLNKGERTLQIPVKQEGISQFLTIAQPYAVADGRSEAALDFRTVTNIPLESISASVEYIGLQKDWISDVSLSDGSCSVTALANGTDIVRRAKCKLSYTDGWGRERSTDIYLTQTDRDGLVGRDATIAVVKALASEAGTLIGDDYVLEGLVVSDCSSANMALNPPSGPTMADTTFSRRVAYIEAEDASWGLRLIFDDASENNLKFGSKISLGLYGTTATRETGPERYSLSGVTGWNICSTEEGASVPEKTRTLSQLAPDDIYTYLTLENMEFAFKRGSYADVMEDYAIKTALNESVSSKESQLDGWASLLVDDTGAGIYAPVNMCCPWRRSGNGVPQGSGAVRGILVSEDMPRMGNVGDWQIRVLDESGFEMGGTSTLQEYAYWINSYGNRNNYSSINPRYAYNRLATIIPSNDLLDGGKTVANAEMTSENTVIPSSRTSDPYTTANYYNALTVSNAGVSRDWIGIGDITTARDWFKWSSDGDLEGYNGFVFSFSTSGVDASHWEFAFDFAGGYTSVATARSWPAHWCVEYSVDDGDSWTLVPDCVSGEPYVHMRGLPWVRAYLNGQWYQTAAQAGMGFTQHSFTLPAEVAGKERVLIKLRPYDRTIVSLPLVWDDDVESSEIDYTTDVDIRIRLGFIYLRYR